MRTLGFAGTAKNTGKTTAALHLLGLAHAAGRRCALTSAGYDGEDFDQVTGLPKPRYDAEAGMLVATAERCLQASSAHFSAIQPTGLTTILGEVLLAQVDQSGQVILAGVNRQTDVTLLLRQLESRGADLVILDGALNRAAALSPADGLVFSTGAAFDERIEVIARHAAAVEFLFSQPGTQSTIELSPHIQFQNAQGRREKHPLSSVLETAVMEQVAAWFEPGKGGECWIPGAFNPELFAEMLRRHAPQMTGSRFIFSSPLHLLASGSPLTWQTCLKQLKNLGASLEFQSAKRLYLLTVNPFYPHYAQKSGQYSPAYVDKIALLETCRRAVKDTPVVDIFSPPYPDLLALCEGSTA